MPLFYHAAMENGYLFWACFLQFTVSMGMDTNEKNRVRCQEWRAKRTPEERRATHLHYRYGITPEQVERMAKKQQYRCAVCKQVKPLVIDHNHQTNTIRALLCRTCNVLVGWIEKHDIEAAMAYLRHHGRKVVTPIQVLKSTKMMGITNPSAVAKIKRSRAERELLPQTERQKAAC
jgi:hypothetical protein